MRPKQGVTKCEGRVYWVDGTRLKVLGRVDSADGNGQSTRLVVLGRVDSVDGTRLMVLGRGYLVNGTGQNRIEKTVIVSEQVHHSDVSVVFGEVECVVCDGGDALASCLGGWNLMAVGCFVFLEFFICGCVLLLDSLTCT